MIPFGLAGGSHVTVKLVDVRAVDETFRGSEGTGGKEGGSGWKGERKGGEGGEERGRKEEERKIEESSMAVFLNCRKSCRVLEFNLNGTLFISHLLPSHPPSLSHHLSSLPPPLHFSPLTSFPLVCELTIRVSSYHCEVNWSTPDSESLNTDIIEGELLQTSKFNSCVTDKTPFFFTSRDIVGDIVAKNDTILIVREGRVPRDTQTRGVDENTHQVLWRAARSWTEVVTVHIQYRVNTALL